MSELDKSKVFMSQPNTQTKQIKLNVESQHDFLDMLAQSSDMLPTDFSTSSLLKNKGQNLTAQKLSQEAGKDYRLMLVKIL